MSVLSPFSDLPGHCPPPQAPAVVGEVEQAVLSWEGAALLCGVRLLMAWLCLIPWGPSEFGRHRGPLHLFVLQWDLPFTKRGSFLLLQHCDFFLQCVHYKCTWVAFHFESWGHTLAIFFSTWYALWRGNYFVSSMYGFFYFECFILRASCLQGFGQPSLPAALTAASVGFPMSHFSVGCGL